MSYWRRKPEWEEAKLAWTTRAIFKNGYVDILPGGMHTDYKGPKRGKKRDAFFQALADSTTDWRNKARELRYSELDAGVAERATLFEDDTIKVIATTNASHGYLYVIAVYKG